MFWSSQKSLGSEIPGKPIETWAIPLLGNGRLTSRKIKTVRGKNRMIIYVQVTTGCFTFQRDSWVLSYLIINHILKFLAEYLKKDYGNYLTGKMRKGGIKDPGWSHCQKRRWPVSALAMWDERKMAAVGIQRVLITCHVKRSTPVSLVGDVLLHVSGPSPRPPPTPTHDNLQHALCNCRTGQCQ